MAQAGELLVNRYKLLDRLGIGAAAEVWRAHDCGAMPPAFVTIFN